MDFITFLFIVVAVSLVVLATILVLGTIEYYKDKRKKARQKQQTYQITIYGKTISTNGYDMMFDEGFCNILDKDGVTIAAYPESKIEKIETELQ